MKTTNCKKCGIEFLKRNNFQKYCSVSCSIDLLKNKSKDHIQNISKALKKYKDRNCIVCGNIFYPKEQFQKCCSYKCGVAHRIKKVNLKCSICSKEFFGYKDRKYCSRECSFIDMSKKRMGKNNPAYRNGFSVKGKRNYVGIHLRACSKYRKEFLNKNDYLYCEICKVNSNGTPRFEVHHIYYASLYPKHKELHNPKNLILLCIRCHNNFHSNLYKKEFLKLEKNRGLKELFR